MLNFIKSLTNRQKRVIMLALDSVLVVFAMMFALSAQGLPGGILENFLLYLPVLPYVLLTGIGVSIWLGVCSIRLKAYETAAIGMTAVFALFLVIASVIVSSIARSG